MKKLLSVLVAAAFAATGFNAVAQTKDVTTKGGAAVVDKKADTNVQTKEKVAKPMAPMPKMKAKAKKEKPATQEVKTKTSGPVVDKKKEEVKAGK